MVPPVHAVGPIPLPQDVNAERFDADLLGNPQHIPVPQHCETSTRVERIPGRRPTPEAQRVGDAEKVWIASLDELRKSQEVD